MLTQRNVKLVESANIPFQDTAGRIFRKAMVNISHEHQIWRKQALAERNKKKKEKKKIRQSGRANAAHVADEAVITKVRAHFRVASSPILISSLQQPGERLVSVLRHFYPKLLHYKPSYTCNSFIEIDGKEQFKYGRKFSK